MPMIFMSVLIVFHKFILIAMISINLGDIQNG